MEQLWVKFYSILSKILLFLQSFALFCSIFFALVEKEEG